MEQEKTLSEEPVKTEENPLVEQLQRLQADFINYRNRVEKEKVSLIDTSKDIILKKFLEVKDNFERIPKADKGVELIYKQIEKIFLEEHVEELCLDLNAPEGYEVIATNDQTADVIVTRKGYTRKGKVLRPAQIILGTKEKNNEHLNTKTQDQRADA